MNEPPPVDFVAAVASQQSFEFLMKSLSGYAVVLFVVLAVMALLAIAACGWETIRVNRGDDEVIKCGR